MTARPNDVDGLLAELDDLLVDDSAKPPHAPANLLSRIAAATPPVRAPPPLRHTPTDDLDALEEEHRRYEKEILDKQLNTSAKRKQSQAAPAASAKH